MVVIDQVSDDERFCLHPTPAMYGFQSYISVPIVRRGEFFGTLCALDPRPAQLKRPEIVQMFTLFAELIGMHLDTSERLLASQEALHEEREVSGLREQFIAVLGHDLRNPLAAIDTSALVLLHSPSPDRALVTLMAQRIRKSSARMAGMIDNTMDFARGRLSGGITLSRQPADGLAEELEHVVTEMRSHHPERSIESDITLDRTVSVDTGRVAQVLSNLLSNAIAHGSADGPVGVQARSGFSGFELIVSNPGPAIPPETMARLFHPFSRGGTSEATGLGLGLYISSEIAKAHGGTLQATSDQQQTSFRLYIPA